jgi:putative flippase GtrA
MDFARFMGDTARYTAVGAVCAGLNNGAIIGAAALGIDYVTSSVASFFVVTPIAYLLHSTVSFRQPRSISGLLRYSGGVVTALPMFLACMFVLSTMLGLPVAIASPVATVLLVLWNYILARWSVLGVNRPPAPP